MSSSPLQNGPICDEEVSSDQKVSEITTEGEKGNSNSHMEVMDGASTAVRADSANHETLLEKIAEVEADPKSNGQMDEGKISKETSDAVSTPPEALDNPSEEALTRDKLETISTYFNLVKAKKNHSMLLKESTVTGFLVLCLGDDVAQVVENSLEVFRILSKCEENLLALKNLSYINDALRCVASNSRVKDRVRKDARNLISALKSASMRDHAPLSELSESMKNVMVSKSNDVNNDGSVVAASSTNNCKDPVPVKKSADLNTTMSTLKRRNKGRETTLFIENGIVQQKIERAKITQALISVPGIISVTYDVKNNFCIVRGKRHVASEEFGRAVARQGLGGDVYLVRKNENKEEIRIPMTANEKENMPGTLPCLPAYPEEQENEEIDDSAAVAKTDQQADDASFFKSAKNFIKRSFYW